jgi:cold shock protein
LNKISETHSALDGTVCHGTVVSFNDILGHGLIKPDGNHRLVKISHRDIEGEGYRSLYDGQRVTFLEIKTKKGPVAGNVVPE